MPYPSCGPCTSLNPKSLTVPEGTLRPSGTSLTPSLHPSPGPRTWTLTATPTLSPVSDLYSSSARLALSRLAPLPLLQLPTEGPPVPDRPPPFLRSSPPSHPRPPPPSTPQDVTRHRSPPLRTTRDASRGRLRAEPHFLLSPDPPVPDLGPE